MWGMNATTIPVVIGALRLIKKGLEKYTQQIPGNIKIHELQKITLLGTPRIPRKALSIKSDFYLILSLSRRNGLGYYVYYGITLKIILKLNYNYHKKIFQNPLRQFFKKLYLYNFDYFIVFFR